MEIRQATLNDIEAIQTMAEVVFRETYSTIITQEQIDFMMEWMYSAESLTEQISAPGKEFFIAKSADGEYCGYVSIEREGICDDGRPLIHLQKIYVMPSVQGCGVGKLLFTHVCQLLRTRYPEGCRMELNVNRNNRATAFYERMGMRRDREGDFPIGNGYYMNDYIYALDIAL